MVTALGLLGLIVGLFSVILMIVGLALFVIGWVGLWIEAFQVSIVWGVPAIIVPVVTVVFAVWHWRAARRRVLDGLIGVALSGLGDVLVLVSGTLRDYR
jgi:hypothetical protein